MKITIFNQVFDNSENDEFVLNEEERADDSDWWIQKCEPIQSLDEELAYSDPDSEFQVSRFIFACIL